MALIREIARQHLFPLALRAGAGVLLRRMSGKRLLNVMYHGVVHDDSTWFSPRHLTARKFEEQLIYLKKSFRIVPLAEAFRMRELGIRPTRHTITLSFDDGYLNNLDVALPIIEKHRVPVTFFLVGACAESEGDRLLWPDLIAALSHSGINRVSVLGGEYRDQVETTRGTWLIEDLKNAMPSDRDAALKDLEERHRLREVLEHIDPLVWKLMGPDQVRSMASSPWVELGSHGHAHYNLGSVPLETAVRDLSRSKTALEQLTGSPLESLAFPDGSYSEAVKDAAEGLGFKRQLAVGLKFPGDLMDLRIQPRHGVSSTTSTASVLFFLNCAFKSRGTM